MTMTPEQAQSLTAFLIADYEHESGTTRRVLGAVPAGQENYSPDLRSMNALKLTWHLASADDWFLRSIARGAFTPEPTEVPESIQTTADVAAWYDSHIGASIAGVKAMPGEDSAKVLDFFGMMQMPAVVFLQLCIKHSVHHRGQLSAYLRPMGGKVPGIYGPSGDTPVS
jgi:uncharacterized damage-inducible protein DinB